MTNYKLTIPKRLLFMKKMVVLFVLLSVSIEIVHASAAAPRQQQFRKKNPRGNHFPPVTRRQLAFQIDMLKDDRDSLITENKRLRGQLWRQTYAIEALEALLSQQHALPTNPPLLPLPDPNAALQVDVQGQVNAQQTNANVPNRANGLPANRTQNNPMRMRILYHPYAQ